MYTAHTCRFSCSRCMRTVLSFTSSVGAPGFHLQFLKGHFSSLRLPRVSNNVQSHKQEERSYAGRNLESPRDCGGTKRAIFSWKAGVLRRFSAISRSMIPTHHLHVANKLCSVASLWCFEKTCFLDFQAACDQFYEVLVTHGINSLDFRLPQTEGACF